MLVRLDSDRHRDASVPILKSSSSTPPLLCSNVVHILPLHSAHADCAHKHGVNPEMLARGRELRRY